MEHSAPPAEPARPGARPAPAKERKQPPAVTVVPLSELRTEKQRIQFLLEGEDRSLLTIRWNEGAIRLRLDDVDDLLAKVRTLYYDTLRGRRGKPLFAGTAPSVEVGIHNQGAAMHLQMRNSGDEEGAVLSFPAVQTSAFLNAARSALESTELSEEG